MRPHRFQHDPQSSTLWVSSVTILPSGVSFRGALNSGGYTRNAPNSGRDLARDRKGSTFEVNGGGGGGGRGGGGHWGGELGRERKGAPFGGKGGGGGGGRRRGSSCEGGAARSVMSFRIAASAASCDW